MENEQRSHVFLLLPKKEKPLENGYNGKYGLKNVHTRTFPSVRNDNENEFDSECDGVRFFSLQIYYNENSQIDQKIDLERRKRPNLVNVLNNFINP